MSRALEDLDTSIKTHLQQYLRNPVAERTQAQYDILVDRLARTAMAYAKALVEERRAARKQVHVHSHLPPGGGCSGGGWV